MSASQRIVAACVASLAAFCSSSHAEEWREQIPSQCTTLVYIGDLYPQVERLVASESLDAALTDLASDFSTRRQAGMAAIQANKRYFPAEAVVSLSPESLESIGKLMRAGLTIALAVHSVGSESTGWQQATGDLVTDFRVPNLALWANFRDEQTAKQLFGLASFGMGSLQRPGVKIENGTDWIEMKVRAGDFATPEMISTFLVNRGFGSTANDPATARLSEVVAAIEAVVRLEWSGSGLRLMTASEPGSFERGELVPILPEVWGSGRNPLLYGQWSLGGFIAEIDQFVALWNDQRLTETGKAVGISDDEGLLGNVEGMLRQLRRNGDRGAGRLDIDDDIRGRLETYGHGPARSLEETGLLRVLPAGKQLVAASSTDSLADWLLDRLLSFEDRLGNNSLKAELSGDEQEVEVYDRMAAFYYRELSGLRELVLEKAPVAFEPPVAVIVRPDGRIDDIEMTIAKGGRSETVSIRGAPLPEFALVARMRTPEVARRFFGKAWREVLDAADPDGGGPAMRGQELGLGVPTAVFVADRLTEQADLHGFTYRASGDPLPHVALLDDWIVLSTSTSLTTSIVAAAKGANSDRLQLPSADRGLVAIQDYPPEVVSSILRDWGNLLVNLSSDESPITLPDSLRESSNWEVSSRIGSGLSSLARVVDLIREYRTKTIQRGEQRTTEMVIRLR